MSMDISLGLFSYLTINNGFNTLYIGFAGPSSYIFEMIYLSLIVRKWFKNREQILKDKIKGQFIYDSDHMAWIISTLTFLSIMILGFSHITNVKENFVINVSYYFLFANVSVIFTYVGYIYKLKSDLYGV
ncbi:hypothetical protein [Apilactobacillus timberlakei]|uniref:hypothetical protein n=1 Tax=Apilactobacillus timberlakei TaxID=2008380 RepID=UPI00112A1FC8|nr:hypothetical protein [Apilactobacillus timberlakei]